MFTGLVEEIGIIADIDKDGSAKKLTIRCQIIHDGTKIGDSISINGCCLTVVGILEDSFTFEAGSETLSRTNLGELVTGSPVNLERSLRPTDRLGGHYVSGHVDALGTVHEISQDGQWAQWWFRVPQQLTMQMASKGSITVDGISLTLVNVDSDKFSVALIPHTLAATTLGQKTVGDRVNIETDILAKYVQKQFQFLDFHKTESNSNI